MMKASLEALIVRKPCQKAFLTVRPVPWLGVSVLRSPPETWDIHRGSGGPTAGTYCRMPICDAPPPSPLLIGLPAWQLRIDLIGGPLPCAALLPPGSAALLDVEVAEPGPDRINPTAATNIITRSARYPRPNDCLLYTSPSPRD